MGPEVKQGGCGGGLLRTRQDWRTVEIGSHVGGRMAATAAFRLALIALAAALLGPTAAAAAVDPADVDLLTQASVRMNGSAGALAGLFVGSAGDVARAVNGKRERVDCGRGKDSARVDAVDKTKGCEKVKRVKKR
jgi:hypothetical protein